MTSGQVSYPSSSLTSTLNNGNGAIDIKRTSEASPSVTGELDIEFNGETRTGISCHPINVLDLFFYNLCRSFNFGTSQHFNFKESTKILNHLSFHKNLVLDINVANTGFINFNDLNKLHIYKAN